MRVIVAGKNACCSGNENGLYYYSLAVTINYRGVYRPRVRVQDIFFPVSAWFKRYIHACGRRDSFLHRPRLHRIYAVPINGVRACRVSCKKAGRLLPPVTIRTEKSSSLKPTCYTCRFPCFNTNNIYVHINIVWLWRRLRTHIRARL